MESGAYQSWNGAKVKEIVYNEIDLHMIAAGQAVVRMAQQLAPKRTGALAASIRDDYDKASKTLKIIVGMPYGLFQEFGTYKMRPHPFIRPALLAAGPSISARGHVDVNYMTTLPVNYTPHKILAHIKPHIAAANLRLNRENVRRASLTYRHVDKAGGVLMHKTPRGEYVTRKSSLSKLHRMKRAWK